MNKTLPGLLLVTLLSLTAFAQNAQIAGNKDALPNTFLRGKHVRFSRIAPGGPHAAKKNMPNAASLSLGAGYYFNVVSAAINQDSMRGHDC